MEWQHLLEALSRKLKLTCDLKKKLEREDELMSDLWTNENIRKLISLWLEDRYNKKESKCIAKAQDFKTIGNKEFQAKNYIQSIRSYTKCALYAPADSYELSIAIANRSASLFYLNRYDDCIKDIELAIKLNYPMKLHYKLYLRAVQCYSKLGKPNLAKETLCKIHEMIDNADYITFSMKDDIEKRISKLTFTELCIQPDVQNTSDLVKLKSKIIFHENLDFPYASASIDIKYNEEFGRHVVANRFIKKGDILFLEKPVSFVLLNHDTLNYLCHHCNHLNIETPVPCTLCSNTLYCDVKCLNEAWSSYHRWECSGNQIGIWKEIGIGHLALKVLLTCTTTTNKIKFNDMQNLVTNFDKLSIEDLTVYGITALMLTIYLLEYTDFFKINNLNDCLVNKFSDSTFNSNFNIVTNNDIHLYVSSLLLRYILQLICNGHAITKSNILSSKTDSSMDDQDFVATGIYPSASMMNHSCGPNIINIFVDQYLIVRAAKDIAPNEEIFNCYGPHYRHMPREQRQKLLKSQYCFICKCKPCTLPKLQYFVERFNGMKCLKCDGALYNIKDYLQCLDCDDRPKIYNDSKIKQAEEIFQTAQASIDSGKMEEALDKLTECLHIRKNVLYKYNENITFILNLMAEIYVTIGQWVNAIACFEDTITAVTKRFGCSSIELLNELNNLTIMYITYLQKESNTTTDTYRNMFKKTQKYLDQIEELTDFNCGSWSEAYEDVQKKQEIIVSIL